MEYRIIGTTYCCHTGGRTELGEDGIRIAVPEAGEGSALLMNGRRFPIRDGSVRLPREAFISGINRITLVRPEGRIPAEGILVAGGSASPAGASLPEIIRALDSSIARLADMLDDLDTRIAKLEDEEGLFG